MTFNPHIHQRRTLRLPGYDYSQPGAYFVTLCAYHRECLFGAIANGEMVLNEAGLMVEEAWKWLATQYDHIQLDRFVIMPNHIHCILIITKTCKGGSRTAPTNAKHKPIGRLAGVLKTVSAKHFNILHNTPGNPIWQRNTTTFN